MSFSYPSRGSQVALNNVSLFFPAGETTFVLGRSGSGKSTLSNLLLRFYDPSSGSIRIDGEYTQELNIGWLRNNITVVQQHTILFNETLFRNIALGHNDYGEVTKSEAKSCIDVADLVNTVLELPDGLDTSVGSDGSSLSGGQRQRVAIARARLRNTAILILDEATNALDYASKQKVMQAIRKWRYGRTTIIVTHDVSQIGLDDYAYVLDEGRVTEEGYRRNLQLKKNGFLARQSAIDAKRIAASTTKNGRRLTNDRELSLVGESPRSSACSPVSGGSHLDQNLIAMSKALPPLPDAEISQRRSRAMSIVPMAHIGRMTNARRASTLFQSPSRQMAFQPADVACTDLSTDIQTDDVRARDSLLVSSRSPRRSMRRLPNLLTTSHLHEARDDNWNLDKIDTENNLPIPDLQQVLPRRLLTLRQILRTVWPSLNKVDRTWLLGGYFFAVVHAASTPVFSWVFSRLLATFFKPRDSRSSEDLRWSMAVLGVAIVDAVSSYLMHFLLERAGQAWVDSLRAEAMQRILDQPKEWYDTRSDTLEQLVTSLDRSAEEMRNLIGRFSGFILVAMTIVITALTWCLIVCWRLTVVGISTGPILYAITRGFEVLSGRWEGHSNAAGEAIANVFTETFSNIRTIRALTLEAYFHKKYDLACFAAIKTGFRRAILSGFFFGISDGSVVLVCALVFWYGGLLATAERYSVNSIITVITMLMFSISGANAIVAFIPQINSSRDTASQVLSLASLPFRESHEHKGRIRISKLPGTISFNNISYHYATHPKHDVLASVSFSIPLKTFTVLAGASGSGKSTLIALLLGLYPLSQRPPASRSSPFKNSPGSSLDGVISIGQYPLSSLHLPTFRSLIGYVRQHPTLFPGTIASNIIYGLPEDSQFATDASIRGAAILAGIDGFIDSLPRGLSTLVGEGGTTLSGGQVQRVAIARALVRQPQLLILDEPTSSLDPQGARLVRDSLKKLVTGGVTVLVVTHSIEMMKVADRIVLLESGKVAEQGSFDRLMAIEKGQLKVLLAGGDELA